MKKILLLIVSVMVSVGMNAQGIEIQMTTGGATKTIASYKNDGTTTTYKAILKQTPTSPTPGTPTKGLITDDDNLIQAWFSVESGKQVQFTKSNLWYGTKKLTSQSELESSASYTEAGYHFESNQEDYYYPSLGTDYSADHVCRFFWSTTTDNSGTADYLASGHEPYAATYDKVSQNLTDAFCYGESNKDNISVDGKTGYYALTMPERYYLLEVRSGNRFAKAMVNSVNGLLIFPDGYTLPSGYSATDGGTGMAVVNKYDAAFPTASIPDAEGNNIWTNMQNAGVVFLPAAGTRQGSTLGYGGTSGYYWSATPYDMNATNAYNLNFYGTGFKPAHSLSRSYGYSVRLVR